MCVLTNMNCSITTQKVQITNWKWKSAKTCLCSARSIIINARVPSYLLLLPTRLNRFISGSFDVSAISRLTRTSYYFVRHDENLLINKLFKKKNHILDGTKRFNPSISIGVNQKKKIEIVKASGMCRNLMWNQSIYKRDVIWITIDSYLLKKEREIVKKWKCLAGLFLFSSGCKLRLVDVAPPTVSTCIQRSHPILLSSFGSFVPGGLTQVSARSS